MKKIYVLTILILLGYSSVAQIIVDFQANHTTPTPDLIVTFTPTLISSDVNYSWSFSPTTVSYVNGTNSESEVPEVKFNEFKKYTVTLNLTGGFGTTTITKNDYIKVRPEYEIGINEDEASHYINVQVRVNSGDLPSGTNKIQDIEFGIMWNKVIINGNKIDLDLACADVNPYHITQNSSPIPHNYGGDGGWDFRNFELINGTNQFAPPEPWIYGKWMTIVQLQVFPRTPGDHEPQGQFLIVPNENHFGNSPKDIDPIMKVGGVVHLLDTMPETDPMGAPWLDIPTNIHGYRWVGGRGSDGYDDYSWNHGANWNNGCGGESSPAATPPGIYDDCIIPNVDNASGCYPRYTRQTNPTELVAVGQDISVVDGGRIEWMYGLNSTERVLLQTQGYLDISGSSNVSVYSDGLLEIGGDSIGWIAPLNILGDTGLRIKSGGWVDTKYTTSIKGDSALIIEADANGVGSFINHGEILYSNGGTAKVQTFVTGSIGDYYMHFVGPTVEDTATGYNNGVRLQQFDMTTLDTYAFEWDASIDPDNGQPWVNVWPFDYGVALGNGLSLSNYEAGTGTIEMVGKINYDPITYNAQSTANNNLELISNPYSSAIDFDAFASLGNNENIINNKYYIYDASVTGNWITRVNGTGGQQFLQVGQGFFVETIQSGTITFDTTLRVHNSTDAFRELITNRLKLEVYGGEYGFKDELYVMFLPEATMGYDNNLEAKKWESYSSGATMIRSIADDGTELAINALDAKKYYQEEVVSVPVHFQCGYDGTYTFDFSGMDSFDPGAEIWLEDKQINQNNIGERSSVKIAEDHHMYSFTASPDDAHDRFVIHFFGPSYLPNAVDENSAADKVKIYSSGNSVYILNNSNEEIKEMSVYNMLGQEILRSKVPIQELNKIDVNMTTGYYAVRVLTDKNVYSEKVFIKAY
ncbi:MAG: T9SS type A sorting domain-containing protein [Bacteroidetes bacterium]|nr:T9SS type A sorting domain-containing protein [Bacteroidota bacterium]